MAITFSAPGIIAKSRLATGWGYGKCISFVGAGKGEAYRVVALANRLSCIKRSFFGSRRAQQFDGVRAWVFQFCTRDVVC